VVLAHSCNTEAVDFGPFAVPAFLLGSGGHEITFKYVYAKGQSNIGYHADRSSWA